MSKNELKKTLHRIKCAVSPAIEEIKYVSCPAGTRRRFNVHTALFRRYRRWIEVETRMFRRKFKSFTILDGFGHNATISRNLCSYYKDVFEPSAIEYILILTKKELLVFTNNWKQNQKERPLTGCHRKEAPRYKEITKTRKLKSNESPVRWTKLV